MIDMTSLKEMICRLFAGSNKHPETPDEECDVQYTFVERRIDDNYTQVGTKITSGKYAGLVFSTGPVQFSEVFARDNLGAILTDASGEPVVETISMNYKFVIEFKPEGMEVCDDLDQIIGDIVLKTVMKETGEADS